MIAVLAVFSAVTAYLGAAGLALMFLTMGDDVTARLPWENTVVAGVALAGVVALPMTVLSVLAIRGDRRTEHAAVVAGSLLVGWIVVQIVIIDTFTWFQPVYLAVGLAVLYAGSPAVRQRR